MIGPAAARDYSQCRCSAWIRADLAGTPKRCNFCGFLLVDEPAPVLQSSILSRIAFRSRSLRIADQAAATSAT